MKQIIQKFSQYFFIIGLSLLSHNVIAQPLPVEVIYHSGNCGYIQEEVSEIGQTDLKNIFNHHNQFVIPAIAIPDINFNHKMLILATMGQKETLGYSVTAQHDEGILEANLIDGDLQLPIKFSFPEDGRLEGQIISSPCMVLQTNKIAYKQISFQLF